MKTSVESTGKTIEQAIENALFELKTPREDVDIKILEEGGFFKKAKVAVSISEDAIAKYESRETQAIRTQEEPQKESKQELQKENKECCCHEDCKCGEDCQCGEEDCKCGENCTCEKDDKDDCKCGEDCKCEEGDCHCDDDCKCEEDCHCGEECKQPSELTLKAVEFISQILQNAKLTAEAVVEEHDDDIKITLTGAGELIGYRGESLNALQYLTNVYLQKQDRKAKRVHIDIDGYRQKREETLIALAKRMEQKVSKTHSTVKLEPMNANERRIIHSALSESDLVSTASKGEEPHRFLVIYPKD